MLALERLDPRALVVHRAAGGDGEAVDGGDAGIVWESKGGAKRN